MAILTDEQKALKEMVGKFAEKEIAPYVSEWEKEEKFSRPTFDKLGELGLTGIIIPEKYGGGGMDYLSYALVIEELTTKAGLGVAYLVIHHAVETAILASATEEQKMKYLKPLAEGKALGGYAQTEPHTGSDVSAIRTRAELKGDKYVLNGTKTFISNAAVAQIYFVLAVTDKEKGSRGMSCFIVEDGTPGLSFGKQEEKMGMNYIHTRDLILEDCEIPAENIVGEVNQGFKVAMNALDASRIGVAALGVGLGQAAINGAVKYTKEREAFGAPIATFQGLQFMMADMVTEVQAARLLTYDAAEKKDHGENITMGASMAKRYATDTAMKVTTDAVQLLGGYGYMKEYGLERYMREAKVTQIIEGTSQIQKLIIARELLK